MGSIDGCTSRLLKLAPLPATAKREEPEVDPSLDAAVVEPVDACDAGRRNCCCELEKAPECPQSAMVGGRLAYEDKVDPTGPP